MEKEEIKYTIIKSKYDSEEIIILAHNVLEIGLMTLVRRLPDINNNILVIDLTNKTNIGLKSWIYNKIMENIITE